MSVFNTIAIDTPDYGTDWLLIKSIRDCWGLYSDKTVNFILARGSDDVANVPKLWMACGNNGQVAVSSDEGVTWTDKTSNLTSTLWGTKNITAATDTFNGGYLGQFIIGGSEGTVAYSTDGESWTLYNSGAGLVQTVPEINWFTISNVLLKIAVNSSTTSIWDSFLKEVLQPQNKLRGDLNQSGSITLSDSLLALRYADKSATPDTYAVQNIINPILADPVTYGGLISSSTSSQWYIDSTDSTRHDVTSLRYLPDLDLLLVGGKSGQIAKFTVVDNTPLWNQVFFYKTQLENSSYYDKYPELKNLPIKEIGATKYNNYPVYYFATDYGCIWLTENLTKFFLLPYTENTIGTQAELLDNYFKKYELNNTVQGIVNLNLSTDSIGISYILKTKESDIVLNYADLDFNGPYLRLLRAKSKKFPNYIQNIDKFIDLNLGNTKSLYYLIDKQKRKLYSFLPELDRYNNLVINNITYDQKFTNVINPNTPESPYWSSQSYFVFFDLLKYEDDQGVSKNIKFKFIGTGLTGEVQTKTAFIIDNTAENSWNIINSGAQIRDIMYSQTLSKYLAVGDNKTIYSSNDSINWEFIVENYSNSNNEKQINSITENPGSLIVAVGNEGLLLTKTAAGSWTTSTISLDGNNLPNLIKVVYGGGKYVTIDNKSNIFYSSNGTLWTKATKYNSGNFLGEVLKFKDLIWTGSEFIIVSENSGVLSSTDGVVWNDALSTYKDIAWNGSLYVAVSKNTNSILKSSNGTTWTSQVFSNKPNLTFSSITSGTLNSTNYFVMICNNPDTAVYNAATVMYSSDGTNWTISEFEFKSRLVKVVYNNGVFYVTGSSTSGRWKIYKSSDLVTWSEFSNLSMLRGYTNDFVIYDNKIYGAGKEDSYKFGINLIDITSGQIETNSAQQGTSLDIVQVKYFANTNSYYLLADSGLVYRLTESDIVYDTNIANNIYSKIEPVRSPVGNLPVNAHGMRIEHNSLYLFSDNGFYTVVSNSNPAYTDVGFKIKDIAVDKYNTSTYIVISEEGKLYKTENSGTTFVFLSNSEPSGITKKYNKVQYYPKSSGFIAVGDEGTVFYEVLFKTANQSFFTLKSGLIDRRLEDKNYDFLDIIISKTEEDFEPCGYIARSTTQTASSQLQRIELEKILDGTSIDAKYVPVSITIKVKSRETSSVYITSSRFTISKLFTNPEPYMVWVGGTASVFDILRAADYSGDTYYENDVNLPKLVNADSFVSIGKDKFVVLSADYIEPKLSSNATNWGVQANYQNSYGITKYYFTNNGESLVFDQLSGVAFGSTGESGWPRSTLVVSRSKWYYAPEQSLKSDLNLIDITPEFGDGKETTKLAVNSDEWLYTDNNLNLYRKYGTNKENIQMFDRNVIGYVLDVAHVTSDIFAILTSYGLYYWYSDTDTMSALIKANTGYYYRHLKVIGNKIFLLGLESIIYTENYGTTWVNSVPFVDYSGIVNAAQSPIKSLLLKSTGKILLSTGTTPKYQEFNITTTSPYDKLLYSYWDGSRFIVTRYNQNRVYTSSDGSTWTENIASDYESRPIKIINNGSTYLGLNFNPTTLVNYTDSNFLTTTFNRNYLFRVKKIIWDGSKFVVVTSHYRRMYTSTDGLTWSTFETSSGTTPPNGFTSIAHNNGLYVALPSSTQVSKTNLTLYTTSNLQGSWTTRTVSLGLQNPIDYYNRFVDYVNNKFYANCSYNNSESPLLFSSSDGVTWNKEIFSTNITTNHGSVESTVVYGLNRYILFVRKENTSNTVYTYYYKDINSNEWILSDNEFVASRFLSTGNLTIKFINNRFVLILGNKLYTSLDGNNWIRQVDVPWLITCIDIVFINNYYIIIDFMLNIAYTDNFSTYITKNPIEGLRLNSANVIKAVEGANKVLVYGPSGSLATFSTV